MLGLLLTLLSWTPSLFSGGYSVDTSRSQIKNIPVEFKEMSPIVVPFYEPDSKRMRDTTKVRDKKKPNLAKKQKQKKPVRLHPLFKTPIVDSVPPTYKEITIYENPITYRYSIDKEKVEFVPSHKGEDLFIWYPHTFLRDKKEPGQFNELLLSGLGRRYQLVFIDDVLMNDPISMKGNWLMLATKDFASFSVLRGYEAVSRGSMPFSVEYHTPDYVAALGYTHVKAQDFYGKATLVDGSFTVNFSERVNFYGRYSLETNSGFFRNNLRESSPFSLLHKFNMRWRYEIAKKTYFILSGRYHELNIVPFGGVDYQSSKSFDFKLASPRNRDSKLFRGIGNVKAEVIVPTLGFLHEKENQLKTWLSLSLFENKYYVAGKHEDTAFSIRATAGASQVVSLPFLKFLARARYDYNSISDQNVVGSDISAWSVFHLSGHAKTGISNILKIYDLDIGVSGSMEHVARLSSNVFHVLNPSFGGDIGIKAIVSDSLVSSLYGSIMYTSRLSSLEETYGRTEFLENGKTNIVEGLGDNKLETIFMWEVGANLDIKTALLSINTNLAFTQTLVFNPIALVQSNPTLENQAVRRRFYEQMESKAFNYTSLSLKLDVTFWKIEFQALVSYLMDFYLLDNHRDQSIDISLIDNPIYTENNSVNDLKYLPRITANTSAHFHSKLFNDKLELKLGAQVSIATAMLAAAQTDERLDEIYFNIYKHGEEFYDNNAQYGAQGFSWKIDLQLFAKFNQITFFVFFENLLNTETFNHPIYPETPFGIRYGVSWTILD